MPYDLVRTDVLRDSTSLARNNIGRSDTVEQQRFPMVHMAHNGYDRCSRKRLALFFFLFFFKEFGQELRFLFFTWVNQANFGVEFGGKQFNHVVSE